MNNNNNGFSIAKLREIDTQRQIVKSRIDALLRAMTKAGSEVETLKGVLENIEDIPFVDRARVLLANLRDYAKNFAQKTHSMDIQKDGKLRPYNIHFQEFDGQYKCYLHFSSDDNNYESYRLVVPMRVYWSPNDETFSLVLEAAIQLCKTSIQEKIYIIRQINGAESC